MKKRPLSLILTGLVIAGIAAVAAPGCGRSVAGEYRRICVALCESGDDCESYAGFLPVDREDCIDDVGRTLFDQVVNRHIRVGTALLHPL